MEEEIAQYIENMSTMLNGQLRGFIDKKAREENLELIRITLSSVLNDGINLGEKQSENKESINKLKILLENDDKRIK